MNVKHRNDQKINKCPSSNKNVQHGIKWGGGCPWTFIQEMRAGNTVNPLVRPLTKGFAAE